jgi:hypothetical protein
LNLPDVGARTILGKRNQLRVSGFSSRKEKQMAHVTYEIVKHDGGYAYKVADVFSETFRSHQEALDAAIAAADRQQASGSTSAIQYQDAEGKWHTELARGTDRPETEIEDDLIEPTRK